GLRRVVSILDDHELGLAQGLLQEIEIGHGRGRICAEYPARANGPVEQAFEDLEGRAARHRSYPSCGNSPVPLDHCPGLWVAHVSVAGEQVRAPSGLAAAPSDRVARE